MGAGNGAVQITMCSVARVWVLWALYMDSIAGEDHATHTQSHNGRRQTSHAPLRILRDGNWCVHVLTFYYGVTARDSLPGGIPASSDETKGSTLSPRPGTRVRACGGKFPMAISLLDSRALLLVLWVWTLHSQSCRSLPGDCRFLFEPEQRNHARVNYYCGCVWTKKRVVPPL